MYSEHLIKAPFQELIINNVNKLLIHFYSFLGMYLEMNFLFVTFQSPIVGELKWTLVTLERFLCEI